MSTSTAGVADTVRPSDDRVGSLGSSASRAGPIVPSERAELERADPSVEARISAASIRAAAAAFAGASLGCLATLHLSAFGVVPEIASALVTTLLGGLLLISRPTTLLTRDFVPAVYGGAFGGMTSVHWPNGIGSDPVMLAGALFISLSIVCGLAFGAGAVFDVRSGHRFASGYGGRSGVIATVACVLFVPLAVFCGADDGLFHAARADLTDFNLGSLATIVAACLAGTTVSLLVLRRERVVASDLANKTFVASAIALAGLIVVRTISPADALLLDAYYAGCFLGMSSRERLKGCIEAMLGAVVLASLIIHVGIFLPGIGGGLGLAAFATVAVLAASRQLARFVLPASWSEPQLSGVRSPAGHGMTKPAFEGRRSSRMDLSWRPAAAIAGLAVSAAMLGGLIWPTLFASNESVRVAAAPMSVADEVAADPAAPQTEVQSSAVDAATPLDIAKANSVSTAPDQTASNEDTSEAGAANPVELKSLNAVVDAGATGSEEPKTAALTVTEVIAVRGPELGETQKTGNSANEAELYREFLQWRAALVVPNVGYNAAGRPYRSRPAAAQTAAATNTQSRPKPPLPIARASLATPPVANPRRPRLGNTTRTATDQAVPASANARESAIGGR